MSLCENVFTGGREGGGSSLDDEAAELEAMVFVD
jgi:hypothetical protein